jgi:hypothetical protein
MRGQTACPSQSKRCGSASFAGAHVQNRERCHQTHLSGCRRLVMLPRIEHYGYLSSLVIAVRNGMINTEVFDRTESFSILVSPADWRPHPCDCTTPLAPLHSTCVSCTLQVCPNKVPLTIPVFICGECITVFHTKRLHI